MGKSIIIFFVVFIILAGLFTYSYLKVEKPKKDEISDLVNININAEDNETGENIITNYTAYGGDLSYNGETLKESPIVNRFYKNSSIYIASSNFEYYNDEIYLKLGEQNYSRVRLLMDKPSELKVVQQNQFLSSNYVSFNLSTENHFRNLIVCAEWTRNIIYVKSNYSTMEVKPSRKYDKCFDVGFSFDENNFELFSIEYKTLGEIKDEDYIKLYFIDSEGGITGLENGNDYWANNTIIKLNNINY